MNLYLYFFGFFVVVVYVYNAYNLKWYGLIFFRKCYWEVDRLHGREMDVFSLVFSVYLILINSCMLSLPVFLVCDPKARPVKKAKKPE